MSQPGSALAFRAYEGALMHPLGFVGQLTDAELLEQLHTCVFDERLMMARNLVFLGEVDARRLFRDAACRSMFDYCVRRLKMSEGRAYRRLAAAKIVRRYPFLVERLERGEVHISALAQISTYLTDDNVHEIVDAIRGKNRLRIEMYLAARFGAAPFVPFRGEMLAMDDELLSLVTWARDHFSNAIPDGDLTKVTKRVYAELKARIEKEDREILAGPVPVPTRPTKRIPKRIRRYVQARDGGRCTFVDPVTGERCQATAHLDIDHIKGRADGGSDEVHNLRQACDAHNLWYAERRYGTEYIRRRIHRRRMHLRQRKSRPKPGSDEPPST